MSYSNKNNHRNNSKLPKVGKIYKSVNVKHFQNRKKKMFSFHTELHTEKQEVEERKSILKKNNG